MTPLPLAVRMASVGVGSVRGIPLQLHWSFLLVLPVFAWLMAQAYFAPAGQLDTWSWVWGSLLAVGLFASVMLHELAHSLTALREGIGVRHITLLPIGGVSAFRELPEDPGSEFRITFVGPLTNFVIGLPILALALTVTIPDILPRFSSFVFWFGAINVVLGAFNLFVPAFPMDGGRILRSILARFTTRVRATKIAATVGRVLAVGMGLWGFLTLLQGGWLLLLIAFFIYTGATQEERSIRVIAMLEEFQVKDLMTGHVDTLPENASVEQALDRMLETRHLVFPVVRSHAPSRSDVVGLARLDALQEVPESDRWSTPLARVTEKHFTAWSPEDAATVVTNHAETGQALPALVFDAAERLVGIVTSTDVQRFVHIVNATKAQRGSARRGRMAG